MSFIPHQRKIRDFDWFVVHRAKSCIPHFFGNDIKNNIVNNVRNIMIFSPNLNCICDVDVCSIWIYRMLFERENSLLMMYYSSSSSLHWCNKSRLNLPKNCNILKKNELHFFGKKPSGFWRICFGLSALWCTICLLGAFIVHHSKSIKGF